MVPCHASGRRAASSRPSSCLLIDYRPKPATRLLELACPKLADCVEKAKNIASVKLATKRVDRHFGWRRPLRVCGKATERLCSGRGDPPRLKTSSASAALGKSVPTPERTFSTQSTHLGPSYRRSGRPLSGRNRSEWLASRRAACDPGCVKSHESARIVPFPDGGYGWDALLKARTDPS
jgi:hypothetical protein